ncbi:MAG: LOG family protein [Candidatus Acidiferrum sp.]
MDAERAQNPPMGEKIVTVFGSSRPQRGDADYEEAQKLGTVLAQRGFSVCTGGYGGVMEAASRGAKDGGGKTYGVTAEFFSRNANQWIDVEVRKKTWQERLFALIELGDGFVACKGGTGTLVELAVVWEMLNKSVMAAKPLVVLGDFWQPILQRVREVELRPPSAHVWAEANGKLVHSAKGVEEAVGFLAAQLETGNAKRENRK